MSELLPCPFCGHEPEMFQIGQNKVKIKCGNCLIEKEQKVLRNSIEWLKGVMTDWWNKRVPMPETMTPKESVTTFTAEYDDTNPDYIKNTEDGI